jgi:hypothetical protein
VSIYVTRLNQIKGKRRSVQLILSFQRRIGNNNKTSKAYYKYTIVKGSSGRIAARGAGSGIFGSSAFSE